MQPRMWRSVAADSIFVNCGGGLRLRQLLKPHPQVKMIVLDSNRPVNLINVKEEKQIIIVDDDQFSIENQINELTRKLSLTSEDTTDAESDLEEFYYIPQHVSELYQFYDPAKDNFDAALNAPSDSDCPLQPPPAKRPRLPKVYIEQENGIRVRLLTHHRCFLKAGFVQTYYELPMSFGTPTSLLLCKYLSERKTPVEVWAAALGTREHQILNRCPQVDWDYYFSELQNYLTLLIENISSGLLMNAIKAVLQTPNLLFVVKQTQVNTTYSTSCPFAP
ncbi:hypothetical protein GEMRC1_000089 [Eukaryota sp. GEM-RC1]